MIILVLNSGSSSLKYQLINTQTKEVLAKIEKNNQKYPVEKAKGKSDKYTKL